MNPLDPLEFEKIVADVLGKDSQMPLHTDTTAKVPFFYGSLPKDFMEHSAKKMDLFLNDKLHLIEEIYHRRPKEDLASWFRSYSVKYYQARGILAHDGFFRQAIDFESKLKHRMTNLSSRISFGHTNGPQLQSGNNGGGFTSANTGTLFANNTTVDGTPGQFYNRVSVGSTAATGNVHIGAYDDDGNGSLSTSMPSARTADTGSIPLLTGSPMNTVTEWALGTARQWLAFTLDGTGGSSTMQSQTPAASQGRTRSFTYASLPNPFGGSPSVTSLAYYQLMAHS